MDCIRSAKQHGFCESLLQEKCAMGKKTPDSRFQIPDEKGFTQRDLQIWNLKSEI
jgi:hypothetical protein